MSVATEREQGSSELSVVEVALGLCLSQADGPVTGCSLAQVATCAEMYTAEIGIPSDPWVLFLHQYEQAFLVRHGKEDGSVRVC